LQSAQGLLSATAAQPQSVAISLTPSGVPTYQAFDASASQVLGAFVSQNAHNIDEVVSTNHVLLFDTNPSDFSSPDYAIKTWSMTDGSTISIIGLLPHNLMAQA
jgi:hypothetical protein